MTSNIYKGIAACYTHLHNRNCTLYDKTYARMTERAIDLIDMYEAVRMTLKLVAL